MKLKKGNEAVSVDKAGTWKYWVEDEVSEIDADGYFDSRAGDLCDPNPIHMIGRKATVYKGTYQDYVRAEFEVVGFKWVYHRPPTQDNLAGDKKQVPIVKRTSDWLHWSNETGFRPAPALEVPKFIRGDGEVKWNPGKKVHEVILNDAVVFASADKAEATAVALGNKSLAA